MDNDPASLSKQLLPSYTFIRTLQTNSIATTVLLQQPNGLKCVAKIVHISGVQPHTKELFISEANLLKRCETHPNIIKLIDFMQLDDYYILVTEYANCGDLLQNLNQHIQNHQKIKPGMIYSVTAQLASALTFLKQHKILHRDIKLANVFLTKNKENQIIVKLGDFGISKCLEQTIHAKTIIGSLEYISPELAQQKPYGYESDAFSLGITLYTYINGKNPFKPENGDIQQMLQNLIKGVYDPMNCGCRDIDRIVDGLLQVDVERRLSVEKIMENRNIQKVLGLLKFDE